MNSKKTFQSAEEMMEKNIVFIDGLATAKEAVELMRKEDVSSLIVKKRNDQDAYGIIAIQDLILGMVIPERAAGEVNVFEIMRKPIITVPATMNVRYVARLLIRTGLWMAPVEKNGEYIGMISLSRIIMNSVLR